MVVAGLRNYDQWLQSGNPMEQPSWEEMYCANSECKKPYDQATIDALENGQEVGPPWPYCSMACEVAEQDREAVAAEAEAQAWREIQAWEAVCSESV